MSSLYDAQGRLAQKVRGGVTTTLGYDPVSRLASLKDDLAEPASGPTNDVTTSFAYTPGGQIAGKTRSNNAYAFTGYVSLSRGYTANGLNQYANAGSVNFSYDANGNLTGDGTNSYTYDAENRMTAATVNATGYTLRYDPLGRLWQVVLPTKTLEFVHDGDAIVKEYNGATPVWYVHGPGDDDPMIQYNGAGLATRYSLQPDAQGSIVSIADAGGAKAFINTYDEYGIAPTANFGRFQYTGQAWLAQLGLYYYKARMYSPTLGRFMQTDPIGYKDQNNLYAYVGNDPIDGRDPSGLYECQGTGKDHNGGCKFVAVLYHGLQLMAAKKGEAAEEARRRLKTLGAPGERNGVVIKIGYAGGSSASTDATSKGKGTITLDLSVVMKNVNSGGLLRATVDAIGTLGHETGHIEDGPIYSGDIRGTMATERRGYRFDVLTAKSFNVPNVLWTPGMSDAQVNGNVEYWARKSCEVGQGQPC